MAFRQAVALVHESGITASYRYALSDGLTVAIRHAVGGKLTHLILQWVLLIHLTWCAGILQTLPKEVEAIAIDTAGSASTVVLREVHCALLRIVNNQSVEKDKKEAGKGQPTTAKLFSPDSSGPMPWTAQVAQSILASSAAMAATSAKVIHCPCPGACIHLRAFIYVFLF